MLSQERVNRARPSWIRHLCRTLALVAQILVVLVPLSEGREERVLDTHAERQGTAAHVGHHAVVCAACALAGLHGSPADRAPRLLSFERPRVLSSAAVDRRVGSSRALANSSRAPPISA